MGNTVAGLAPLSAPGDRFPARPSQSRRGVIVRPRVRSRWRPRIAATGQPHIRARNGPDQAECGSWQFFGAAGRSGFGADTVRIEPVRLTPPSPDRELPGRNRSTARFGDHRWWPVSTPRARCVAGPALLSMVRSMVALGADIEESRKDRYRKVLAFGPIDGSGAPCSARAARSGRWVQGPNPMANDSTREGFIRSIIGPTEAHAGGDPVAAIERSAASATG